jgi:hypothetical protein
LVDALGRRSWSTLLVDASRDALGRRLPANANAMRTQR